MNRIVRRVPDAGVGTEHLSLCGTVGGVIAGPATKWVNAAASFLAGATEGRDGGQRSR